MRTRSCTSSRASSGVARAWALAVALTLAACGPADDDDATTAPDDDDASASDDDDAAGPDDDDGTPPATLFEDLSATSGLALHEHGGFGVGAADFDGDGWIDLYLTGLSQAGDQPDRLFLNDGGAGTFTDASAAFGLDASTSRAFGVTIADLDDDADPDVLLGWGGPNRLLVHDGATTLTDQTPALLRGDEDWYTAGYAVADYDGDAVLDVYEINHQFLPPPGEPPSMEVFPADRLFRGTGSLGFEDVSALLEEERRAGAGFAAAWTDVDDDADLDLYLVNDTGWEVSNQLWLNDGAGGFVAATDDCGCDLEIDGMGIAVGDYDGDGGLDFYVSNTEGEVLLKAAGGATYVDTTEAVGAVAAELPEWHTSWGVEFFDADNDADVDLFVAFGAKEGKAVADNRLLLNDGGTFTLATDSGFDDAAEDSHGVAVFDLDLDGCLDLAVANHLAPPQLFRNTCGTANHWWGATLIGTDSPRDAAGARVTIEAGGLTQLREVPLGSTSIHSTTWKTVHFGLGSADVIDSVHVRWPSGATTTLTDVPVDAYVEITEGD